MIPAILLAIGAVLGGGVAIALILRRTRGIRGQLLILAASAAILPAVAVVIAGLVMFSSHDVFVLGLLAASSALTSAALAAMLASWIGGRIRAFRTAASEVAAGDLTVRIPEGGPRELHELGVAFNRMSDELHRLFETRRNLVAWASHDLRAPLTALQGMIEALEDGLANPDDYLSDMRRQVRTLSRLVDDLFELSRIETGALQLAAMEVSIGELAGHCVQSLRADATRQGVRLSLADEPRALHVRCDPDKIERVLLNLLTNALRHTPQDGAVAVRVTAAETNVTVIVEDTGPGIPAAAAERVFESFWRADPARSHDTGGAGLGLAIARGLIEAHGGRIWAENRPEGGARFGFSLPLTGAPGVA